MREHKNMVQKKKQDKNPEEKLKQRFLFSLLLFNIILEVLDMARGKDKVTHYWRNTILTSWLKHTENNMAKNCDVFTFQKKNIKNC